MKFRNIGDSLPITIAMCIDCKEAVAGVDLDAANRIRESHNGKNGTSPGHDVRVEEIEGLSDFTSQGLEAIALVETFTS